MEERHFIPPRGNPFHLKEGKQDRHEASHALPKRCGH